MKRTLLIFGIIAMLLSSVYSVTYADTGNSIVAINPLGFVFRLYRGSYEQTINPDKSIEGNLYYTSWDFGIVSWTTIGVGVGPRIYLRKTAPKGFYISPLVNAGMIMSETKDFFDEQEEQTTTFTIGGTVCAGYQWIIGGGFVINPAVSFSILLLPEISTKPSVGVNIGYAW